MARALIAAGVPADHAYQLARRIELDLAERGISAIEVDRLDELAREVLGEQEASGRSAGCGGSPTSRRSTCRSSC